ncbi:acyl-CoA dehydrogenase family protein [Streptomyces cheonanensis]|uniref:Acyl-CoA dehydrogenase family protein n=1 Tax=Streptomyces cheonanensis TaxID=312720 RepID=A0ABP5GYG7_9ACTN
MTEPDPAISAVLQAVPALVPRLRENARAAEDRRWIPEENIELLEDAGVFRLAVPRRFGGLDASMAEQIQVVTDISRGCPSTGWVAAAWLEGAWVASQYPDEVQKEIYAAGTVRTSGGLSPTGQFTATEGGYVLSGSWRFNTGCRGAHWNLVFGVEERPDGTHGLLYALVPIEEFEVADDWHVTAAAGTGSFTTSATEVFVPARRVVTAEELVGGATTDRSNTGATGRNYGLVTYVAAMSVAVFIGAAKGAYETFTERLPGKAIAYTGWTEQRDHPLTQIKVATAANRIAAAEALADGYVRLLQDRADAGEHPTVEDSVTVRGRGGLATLLVLEATDALHDVSTASSLARDQHFQRFRRDLAGLTRHGMMTPFTNLELHGRLLLGLEPDTHYL